MDFIELQRAIELEFGRRITNRPDCESLSEAIYDKTKKSISYNTLRRFFNLAGGKNTSSLSQNTLDILANYCGYTYYSAFESQHAAQFAISTYYRLQLELQQKEQFLISEIETALDQLPDQQQKYNFTNAVILLAFKRLDVDFLRHVFQLKSIFRGEHYLNSNLYFLIQTIGLQIRQHPELSGQLWEAWAQDQQARFYYFELFVDMDTLVTSHYRAIEWYYRFSVNKQDRLFAASLLAWKNLLNGDEQQLEKQLDIIQSISNKNELHPIPVARSYIVRLVDEYSKTGSISNQLLEELKETLKAFAIHEIPFFELWICEGLLLTHQIDLLKSCLKTIRTKLDGRNDYYLKGSLLRINWMEDLAFPMESAIHNQQIPSDKFDELDIFSKEYDSLFYYARDKKAVTAMERSKITELGFGKLFALL